MHGTFGNLIEGMLFAKTYCSWFAEPQMGGLTGGIYPVFARRRKSLTYTSRCPCFSQSLGHREHLSEPVVALDGHERRQKQGAAARTNLVTG
jgi:hypothetical protein